MSLSLRYAARSDVGLIRDGNEDSGYAGPHLLAVADGLGGQAAGEVASSAVVTTVSALDKEEPGPEILDVLGNKVVEANDLLRHMIEEHPQLEGMGTTLTALLWTGSKFGMVHIGDSRAYLLRDGKLQQISQDHTWVQRLVDEGRITADEAEHHPQRSLLMRAIDGRGQVDLDLTVLNVQVGDRYLLCSDGLSSVVSRETLEETLAFGGDPDQVAAALIDLARRAGGPDNITCVLADIVDTDALAAYPELVVGAASEDRHHQSFGEDNPAARAAAMLQQGGANGAPAGFAGPYEAAAAAGSGSPPRRRRRLWILGAILVVLIVAAGAGIAYWWSQSRYYVGSSSGHVAIYQGVDQTVLGMNLSSLYRDEGIPVTSLPQSDQEQLRGTIPASNLTDAQQIVHRLTTDMCQSIPASVLFPPTPTPTPSTNPVVPPPTTPGAPAPTNTPAPGRPPAPAGAPTTAAATPPGAAAAGPGPAAVTTPGIAGTVFPNAASAATPTPSAVPSATSTPLPPSVLAACGAR